MRVVYLQSIVYLLLAYIDNPILYVLYIIMADNADDEPRFLINGTPFSSYQDLTNVIEKLFQADNNESSATKSGKRPRRPQLSTLSLLPPEIVRNIATYFTVKKLDPSKTRALSCSSSSKQHNLRECLVDSPSTWWISSYGSFQNGACVCVCVCVLEELFGLCN